MNIKRIDADIPRAIAALAEMGMAEDGVILGNYRSVISTFGSIISQGGLKPAVAFLNNESDQKYIDRRLLLQAIYYVISGQKADADQIFKAVCDPEKDERAMKERFTEAAVSLKLAMAFYHSRREDEPT